MDKIARERQRVVYSGLSSTLDTELGLSVFPFSTCPNLPSSVAP